MKICILTPVYYPHGGGGQEIFTLELVRQLRERGHRVALITRGEEDAQFPDEGNGEVHQVRSRAFRPFVEISQKLAGWASTHFNEIFSTYGARAARRLIGQIKPDVVFSQAFFGFGRGMPPMLARLGIPWVHYVHSYDLVCKRQTATDDHRNPCVRQCADCRLICRFKHGPDPMRRAVVIYNSAHMRKFCEEAGIVSRESHVIDPVFSGRAPDISGRYEPAAPIRLLYVGRVSPEKGIQVLCDAVASLSGRFQLEVLGGGALLAGLEARHRNDPIRFHGRVDPEQRDALLTGGHALVVPSLWNEPFGRVVHEGFLAGLPVIASYMGGMAGLVNDGVDGIVFKWRPGAEAQSLAEALERAAPQLTRLRAGALETRARIMAQDNFARIEEVLLRAAGEREPGALSPLAVETAEGARA